MGTPVTRQIARYLPGSREIPRRLQSCAAELTRERWDMTLIPVSSSAISAVGHDGYTLTIEFNSGRSYDHPGVPYEVYAGLMAASSKGAYYNRYIRGRYR